VAILSTGDEIVMPGDPVGPNQIVSANSIGLAAVVRVFGGEPVLLGIAPDDRDALARMAAGARGMDMLVTTGGASVGDHDLIQEVLGDAGLELDFWKIAMRPGKPLIFGD
ncbi:MAG TPA: molybdopterin molybdenumtransferase MoeA, partial [Rhodospirillaceae bacterium]|nr:molybdopterin molybdenumtransferase MoeA [Rhodospirillaceae bacterium]